MVEALDQGDRLPVMPIIAAIARDDLIVEPDSARRGCPRPGLRQRLSSRRRMWKPAEPRSRLAVGRGVDCCAGRIALPLRPALRRSASLCVVCGAAVGAGSAMAQDDGIWPMPGQKPGRVPLQPARPDQRRHRHRAGGRPDRLGRRAARPGGGARRGRRHTVRGHALSQRPLCARCHFWPGDPSSRH